VDPYAVLENVSLDAFHDFQGRHCLFRLFHHRMEHRLLTEDLTGPNLTDFRSWEFRQFGRNYSTKLIEQLLQNVAEKVKVMYVPENIYI